LETRVKMYASRINKLERGKGNIWVELSSSLQFSSDYNTVCGS
jgi:hypothetical protein